MRTPIMLKTIASGSETPSGGLLRRAFGCFRPFRRFRLPLRETSKIKQAAALNRAESLFEVTFRSPPWTR